MSTILIDEDHAKNMLLQMWQQCETEDLCDVVLIAGGEQMRIPAHRSVLSTASEFFKKMFTSAMCESTSKEAKMTTTNGSILRSLVEYCYKGRVEINEDIVVEMLEIAHMLILNNVVKACANFLTDQLHSTNCLGFLLLAERYDCETLLQKATDYSAEHFMDVYETDEFLKLNAEQLGQLLASDNICVHGEEHVFNSLMKWIRYDQIDREKHMDKLLRLVRMPLLGKPFLIQHVKPVCNSPESLKIYIDAVEYHLMPGNKIINQRVKSNKILAMTVNKTLKEMYIHYYCPQQLKWMKWLSNLKYRYAFGVAIMENSLYIIGGDDAENILNTVICLNLETMISSEIIPMAEQRIGSRAAVLKGCLYAVGGNGVNSVEKWSPETKVWTKVASMSDPRFNFGIATLNGKMYVIGGYSTFDSSLLNTAECYDPDTNEWNFIPSMHNCRQSPGIAVANGLLYAVGGFSEKTVERYDPVTNEWTLICGLSENLYGIQPCVAFRDEVVVCYKNRVEKYNPSTNEWIASASLNPIDTIHRLFSYSGKLLESKFSKTSDDASCVLS